MKKVLSVLLLCLCLTLVSCSSNYDVACSTSGDSQQSADPVTKTEQDTDTEVSFDVAKYANISGEQLVSMLGEPSSIVDGYGEGFCDISAVYYNYANHQIFGDLTFVLVNNSVVRLTSYNTYTFDEGNFNNIEEALDWMGIKVEDSCRTVVENELARRYRCPSREIDDVFFGLMDEVENGFGMLEITYNMEYYEEWYLPIDTEEQVLYKIQAEEAVKTLLSFPNTAKFPWMGWDYKCNDYYFTVNSSVEAKNAFGVSSTYEFQVIFDRFSSNIVYMEFGGESVNNGYVETKVLLKELHDAEKHNLSLNVGNAPVSSGEKPLQDSHSADFENNVSSDDLYTCNNEDLLFDAMIEYCNKYNGEGGRLFEEIISWRIITPTYVELYLSTEYSLTETQIIEFDALASNVLNEIVSFIDDEYYFPEAITFDLTMEYYMAEDNGDEYYYDTSNDEWGYEDDWYYEYEFDDEETDSNIGSWEYPIGNDVNVLQAALDEFCDGHHYCEYGCTLEANIIDRRSVYVYHTIDTLIPIADCQKIAAIDKQLDKDIEVFVLGYADFPEGLSFKVIPDYWYDTES